MVQKAGSAKIIEMYRCWTPNQLPLLKGNILRVLFMTAPSTGKTAIMEDKALKCFEQGNLLKSIDNITIRRYEISICLQMFSSQ